MDTARQAQVAFYLTGKRPGPELEPLEGLDTRPALMAHYRDLSTLRYDYPLVLVNAAGASGGRVRALSGLVDDALEAVARDEDSERVCQHVLRLEMGLRKAASRGARGPLSELWTRTAAQLGVEDDELLRDSLDRAFAALDADGSVEDCDEELPFRLLSHVWQAAEERKAQRLRREIARLVHRLSNILRADFARSEPGRSPDALRASVGGVDRDAFDFDALSRVLVRTANRTTITESRRQRLARLITALQSYDFEPDEFRFTGCDRALAAWRDRLPALSGVAQAIAMAELEIAGDYQEDRHDAFFEEYGADGLSPEDIALFADYLVCVNAGTMDAQEQAALIEILSSGLPMKVLIQTDDILDVGFPTGKSHGLNRGAPHLANMAIGLNDVFVLQAGASHLLRCIEEVSLGIDYPGAALFSVFSGATAFCGNQPAYLVAAAAVESRAFPVFSYNPAAGSDWASRFSLVGNTQTESDWPVQTFTYENAERRRVSHELAFTFVDFAALDERYARHLALVPWGSWDETMCPVPDALAIGAIDQPDRVPCIQMVDGQYRLQKVLVDEKLMRDARRCRDSWHNLQELGGIHNSHAKRLLAEAREALAGEAQDNETSAEPEASSVAAEESDAALEREPEPSPDEAYVETARCTTCNECTQINDKLFAYNENRQAYIANPDAGTYAQIVEAAESCQVSIIHPGKPRDPEEPGLDELMERAQPFL